MSKNNSEVVRIYNQEYLVSYLHKAKYNWKLISVAPFSELSRESSIFSLIAFLSKKYIQL